MSLELQRGEFTLSADPARLDLDAIHDFLSQTYWAKLRPREVIEKSIRHSLCFGLYRGKTQIGFARAITDYATFAYIADVFIVEEHRGIGLGRWLIESMLVHPDLKHMRRLCLITRDAQSLYQRCGFAPLARPEEYMELLRPAWQQEPAREKSGKQTSA